MSAHTVQAHELHVITNAQARAFLEERLGPTTEWHSAMFRYRRTSLFQEHWATELGHWLSSADRCGILDSMLHRILTRANQETLATTTPTTDDQLYKILLNELAPAMVTHYLAGTRWAVVGGESQPAVGLDVDILLRAPLPNRSLVDVQVKAPNPPSWMGPHLRGEVIRKRFDEAAEQLPHPARHGSLIVICGGGDWDFADLPDTLVQHTIGATTCRDVGPPVLEPEDCGRFFARNWAHVGAVALLNYLAGASLQDLQEHFEYRCTVIINPYAESVARCDRQWFPRASVL